jgi:hypothetical protein
MPARRKLTVRDLPALLVLFGAFFAAVSVGLPMAERMDMANEHDLVEVSGHVDRIYVTNRPKAGPKLQIELRSSGDELDALVIPDKIGRNLEWI